MSIVRIGDYEDSAGKLDWRAYRAAKVANGESCRICGGVAYAFNPSGAPSLCPGCRVLREDAGEVDHDSHARCPFCGDMFSLQDYGLYEAGEHEIECPECEKGFTVRVEFTVTYTSPARVEED